MDDTCPLCFGDGFVVMSIAYQKRQSRCPLCKGSGLYHDKEKKFYGYDPEEE